MHALLASQSGLFLCCHNINSMNSTAYVKASSNGDRDGNCSGADKSPEHMLRSKILAKVPTTVYITMSLQIVHIQA